MALAYYMFTSFGTSPSEILKYSLEEQILMKSMIKKYDEARKKQKKAVKGGAPYGSYS